MEGWMVVQAVGVLLGLGGLVAAGLAFRGKAGSRRGLMVGGGLLLMAVGGFLVLNATALVGPDVVEGESADDFLEGDFGDDF